MLDIDINLVDANGVKVVNPYDREPSESVTLSAMYHMYYKMFEIESKQEYFGPILDKIKACDVFQYPHMIHNYNRDKFRFLAPEPDVDKEVYEFVWQHLYPTINTFTSIYYSICITFSQAYGLQERYPDMFYRLRMNYLQTLDEVNGMMRHPVIQDAIERTWFALHYDLIRLQKEIPDFLASGQDPRLLIATQEELDQLDAFPAKLENFVFRFAKEFVKLDLRTLIMSSPGYDGDGNFEINKSMQADFDEYMSISTLINQAHSNPIQEGLITMDQALTLLCFDYMLEDYELFPPQEVENVYENHFASVPEIYNDIPKRIHDYIQRIGGMVDLYYSIMYINDQQHGQKPIHWFKMEDLFTENWRQPEAMLKQLIIALDYKGEAIPNRGCLQHPFFGYLFDPIISKHKEEHVFEEIVKDIRTKKANIYSIELDNMQDLLMPYNFIEEFGLQIAQDSQQELGKDQVPSQTPFWNLDTGEYTLTSLDGAIIDAKPDEVFQSKHSPKKLKSLITKEIELTAEEQQKQERIRYVEALQQWREANPEEYKKQQDRASERIANYRANFGLDEDSSTPKPKPKPKTK
ncbi:MAG: hypothetical protein ACRCXZ_08190 [Patescibacteria group bacterium]